VPAAAVANVSSSGSTDQVAQLQSLVVQYQQRELQYQQQLQTDQQQLQQANDQIQQFQQLLAALQERGILSIDRNGQVTIHLRRGDD